MSSSSHGHGARRPSGSISSTLAPNTPIDFAAMAEAVTDSAQEMYTDLLGLVSVYRAHPLWFLRCGGPRRARKDGGVTYKDGAPSGQRPRGGVGGGEDTDVEAGPPTLTDHAIAALQDMVSVLSRAHSVCAGMTGLGFACALLGILTYSWTAVPLALGIFASVCMGSCSIVATIALW